MRTKIIRYMKNNIQDHVIVEWLNDDGTRNEEGRVEVNLTSLAEDAATALDPTNTWLDDETHIVWDCAYDVAQWYGDDDCQ